VANPCVFERAAQPVVFATAPVGIGVAAFALEPWCAPQIVVGTLGPGVGVAAYLPFVVAVLAAVLVGEFGQVAGFGTEFISGGFFGSFFEIGTDTSAMIDGFDPNNHLLLCPWDSFPLFDGSRAAVDWFLINPFAEFHLVP